MFDILINGGKIVDPSIGLCRTGSVGIKDGKFSVIGDASGADAIQIINAAGCYVVPGLIDYHVHVFTSGCEFALIPELAGVPNGITTMVDGGSSGVSGFEGFYRNDVTRSALDIKAMLNICSAGQPGVYYLENMNPELFQREKILDLCKRYRGTIVAIKVRGSRDIVKEYGLRSLERAVEIAEEAHLPVVLHATDSPGEIRDTLDILRPGDVFCHCFHQKGKTILGEDGHVLPEVFEAQEKGILFDCAHGSLNFSMKVAFAALSDGFAPDIISSDLSKLSLAKPPAYNLVHIMTELLNLGMSFEAVLKRVTQTPARQIGIRQNGFLIEGETADLAIFREEEKPIHFRDRYGNEMDGSRMLRPMMTIKKGTVLFRQNEFFNE